MRKTFSCIQELVMKQSDPNTKDNDNKKLEGEKFMEDVMNNKSFKAVINAIDKLSGKTNQ